MCDNCREIEQGRFVDLIEIDAASRTKVEDTRDLLDNVQYAPARGRFVYLIDEVHMLSRHSFNALLKTLEEPPAHVKFLLATTDPQKLPVTILSRCLQFHLKALDVEQIRHQLEHILGEEQIAFEPRALQLLSRAADGSLRDALSLTDQAIASGEGQLTAASVSTMLGTLDDDQALSLIEATVAADGERVMAGVNDAPPRAALNGRRCWWRCRACCTASPWFSCPLRRWAPTWPRSKCACANWRAPYRRATFSSTTRRC